MANLRNKEKLSIVHNDLFNLDVEALVNPTNSDLLLGAGLGGQIRKKGGSEIQEECLEIHSLPPGRAAVTGGGALKCRNIIHAAIMKIGGFSTEEFIVSAIKSAANRIREFNLKSVAFPPMGTGVGRFPIRRSAEIMIETILDAVCGIKDLEKVYIVLDDEDMCSLFEDTYTRITGDELIIEINRTEKADVSPDEEKPELDNENDSDEESEPEETPDDNRDDLQEDSDSDNDDGETFPAEDDFTEDEDREQSEEELTPEESNAQETDEHKEES